MWINHVRETVLSADSKQKAYKIIKNSKYFVIHNGQGGECYDRVAGLMFSPDSKHFVYKGEQEGKHFVIYNNQKFGPYDKIGQMAFTPNSKYFLSLIKKENEYYLFVNNKECMQSDDPLIDFRDIKDDKVELVCDKELIFQYKTVDLTGL